MLHFAPLACLYICGIIPRSRAAGNGTLVQQMHTRRTMVRTPLASVLKRPVRGISLLVLPVIVIPAQQLMQVSGPRGTAQLFTSDAAVLESEEARKDIPCTVTPSKPSLGFDLKFHAGYEVSFPLQELAGEGNELTMIFRVAPE